MHTYIRACMHTLRQWFEALLTTCGKDADGRLDLNAAMHQMLATADQQASTEDELGVAPALEVARSLQASFMTQMARREKEEEIAERERAAKEKAAEAQVKSSQAQSSVAREQTAESQGGAGSFIKHGFAAGSPDRSPDRRARRPSADSKP